MIRLTIVAALSLAACTSTAPHPQPVTPTTAAVTTPTAEELPATTTTDAVAVSVFASIAAVTDCATLQESFDRAAESHDYQIGQGNLFLAERSTDFMQANLDRMAELGCP